MRSLFLLFVFLSLLGLGLRAPFVLVLGYVWVDLVTPQTISYMILNALPVSLIFGSIACAAAVMAPRDPAVRLRPTVMLLFVLAAWMTLSLAWAVIPDAAAEKWNWAIKTVVFSCLIPYLIRTRLHVEALVWTLVLCCMAHAIPFGAKVFLSGGGYGKALGLSEGNSGLGEGSTLAMFAIMIIPFCWFLFRHSSIVSRTRPLTALLLGFGIAGILTSLGTYARTGLIAVGVLAMTAIVYAKRKAVAVMLVMLAAAVGSALVADQWVNRMSTMGDVGSEVSAMGRIAVWRWTLEYVTTHPWGGSFGVYRINTFEMPLEDGTILSGAAKAFHSIYFEILGELGFPGLAMFVLIVVSTITALLSARKSGADEWTRDLGTSALAALFVYLVAGAFIGVAFQPFFYYVAAIAVVLQNLSARESMTRAQMARAVIPSPVPAAALQRKS